MENLGERPESAMGTSTGAEARTFVECVAHGGAPQVLSGEVPRTAPRTRPGGAGATTSRPSQPDPPQGRSQRQSLVSVITEHLTQNQNWVVRPSFGSHSLSGPFRRLASTGNIGESSPLNTLSHMDQSSDGCGREAQGTPRAASIEGCCRSIGACAAPLVSKLYPMESADQGDANCGDDVQQRIHAARDLAFWQQWGRDAGMKPPDLSRAPSAFLTPVDLRRLIFCISASVCKPGTGVRAVLADTWSPLPRRWIERASTRLDGLLPSSSRRASSTHPCSFTLCTRGSRRS